MVRRRSTVRFRKGAPVEARRRRIVRLKRYLLNPPMKVAVWLRLVPGHMIVETTGRVSRKRRRTAATPATSATSKRPPPSVFASTACSRNGCEVSHATANCGIRAGAPMFPLRKGSGTEMLIDQSGTLGAEHARDLHRAAAAYRLGRHGHARAGLREFIARGFMGPVHNYRVR